MPLLPVLLFMSVCFVLGNVIQYRRRGPHVAWVARRSRPKYNEWFERNGWPKPFDDDGNKIQPLWTKRPEN